MVFSSLKRNYCGHCTNLLSHYPCNSCCGVLGGAQWTGSYQGTGSLMSGTQWVCLLYGVASAFNLSNAAAGLLPPTDYATPLRPPPPAPAVLTATTFVMTESYDL
mmetsp:Transcript_68231/g.152312  ORF Transcript_68231/g.152312 Transcript_68231/m.152312 type:complete len:105 (-) Transcript_68231:104-418(-)